MSLDPTWIIGLSVGIIMANYSLFQYRLEVSFVTRYKRFKDNFEQWMKEDTNDFYKNLQKKLKAKSNLDELISFVNLCSSRRATINLISGHYKRLDSYFKCICFCLILATLFSIGAVFYPNPIITIYPESTNQFLKSPLSIHFLDVSMFWFIIGLLSTFVFIISMNSLLSRIAQFELKPSMKKVMEEELRGYSEYREKNV